LTDRERLQLNHIRGNAYMNIFGFVEEYIIAQTIQHAGGEVFGDNSALRALLRFGEEELKHQALFKRYCTAFSRDFGARCEVLGSAADVAHFILNKSPAAAMLMTLHIELMTQHHYVGAIKDRSELDPKFKNILKHHWMEEAQHAKIDTLEVNKLLGDADPDVCEQAYGEYIEIVQAFDALLAKQVDMDLESLASAAKKAWRGSERDAIRPVQHQSYRRCFLHMGMAHTGFVAIAQQLAPGVVERLQTLAVTYA
jgi:hypothetical protein